MMTEPGSPLRMTLGEVLHNCANSFADRTCVIQAETGYQFTFREFDARVNQIAHGFRDSLSGANVHVGLMLENSIDYLAMTYALKKLDRIEVSINRAFRGAALARMINLTELEILISSSAHFDAIEGVASDLPHVRVLLVTDGLAEARDRFPRWRVLDFDSVISADDSHIVASSRDTDVATILFTSGTTGVSKGCLLSHRYAVRTAENMRDPFRLTKDDINYTPYPLSHIGPAYYDVLASWLVGGAVVIRDGFSLSNFWPELVKYNVTWFMCLGSVQQLLWAAEPCPEEK